MKEFSVYLDDLHIIYLIDTNYRFNYNLFKGKPSEIVVHHTGETVKSINDIYQEGVDKFKQPMYHFIIDKHGKIFQTLPLNVMGRHSIYDDESSFSIALQNVISSASLTDAMRYSLKKLISVLVKKYNVINVKNHFQVNIKGIEEVLEQAHVDKKIVLDSHEIENILDSLTHENVEQYKSALKNRVEIINVEDLIKDMLYQRIDYIDNCPGMHISKKVKLSEILEEIL